MARSVPSGSLRAASACLLGSLVALAGAGPAQAGGHFYDHSYYRPVHGHARNIFRNPVGKIDTTIPRRLPSLTVKPVAIDFGFPPAATPSTGQALRRSTAKPATPAPAAAAPAAPAAAPKASP